MIDEESRLRCTQPQLLFELPAAFTEASVREFVHRALGTNPVVVERLKFGEFLVTFLNWVVAKKALELHGRKLKGIADTIKVREVQPKLTVDQAFDLIARKLETRERGDHYKGLGNSSGNNNKDRWRSPTRDSRYVRVTESDKSPTRGSDKTERP